MTEIIVRYLTPGDFEAAKELSKDIYISNFRGRKYHHCYLSVKPTFEGWCKDKRRWFWGAFAIERKSKRTQYVDPFGNRMKEEEAVQRLIALCGRTTIDDGKTTLFQALRIAKEYQSKGLVNLVGRGVEDMPLPTLITRHVTAKQNENAIQFNEKRGYTQLSDLNGCSIYLDGKDDIDIEVFDNDLLLVNYNNKHAKYDVFHVVEIGDETKYKHMCKLLFTSYQMKYFIATNMFSSSSNANISIGRHPIIVADAVPFLLEQSNLDLMFQGNDGGGIFKYRFYYSTSLFAGDEDYMDPADGAIMAFSFISPDILMPNGKFACGAIYATNEKLFQLHFQRIYHDLFHPRSANGSHPFCLSLVFHPQFHSKATELVTKIYKHKINAIELNSIVGKNVGFIVFEIDHLNTNNSINLQQSESHSHQEDHHTQANSSKL